MADNPNTRLTAYIVGGLVLAFALYLGWDLYRSHHQTFNCGDGPRYTIDERQFATQYTAYSVKLEASLNDKSKLSLNLDPVQQQKLTEALQSANEFRKYVVTGYNACAINQTQYGQLEPRFRAIDSLAQQINTLATQPSHTAQHDARLNTLVTEYVNAERTLVAATTEQHP